MISDVSSTRDGTGASLDVSMFMKFVPAYFSPPDPLRQEPRRRRRRSIGVVRAAVILEGGSSKPGGKDLYSKYGCFPSGHGV